jgi:hypothetical protein
MITVDRALSEKGWTRVESGGDAAVAAFSVRVRLGTPGQYTIPVNSCDLFC